MSTTDIAKWIDIGGQPFPVDSLGRIVTGTDIFDYKLVGGEMLPFDSKGRPVISGSGGGGIPDAPNDGGLYGRKNQGWTDLNNEYVSKSGDTMTGPLVIPDYSSLKTGADPARNVLPDDVMTNLGFTATASTVIATAEWFYFNDGRKQSFTVPMPFVSATQSGVFAAGDYAAFIGYGTRIENLESRGGTLRGIFDTYADFQAAMVPVPSFVNVQDWIQVLADENNDGAHTQYLVINSSSDPESVTKEWQYGGVFGSGVAYGVATTESLGLKLSTPNTPPSDGDYWGPNDGYTYTEANGQDAVIGWSRVVAAIGTNASAITALNTTLSTKVSQQSGTFTPVLGGSVTDPTGIATMVGYYTKTGKLVHISLICSGVYTNSPSGTVVIRNFPFAPSNAYDVAAVRAALGFGGKSVNARWNATTLELELINTSTGNVLTWADATSTSLQFLISITYPTAS